MAKIATETFAGDGWNIVEEGFEPSRNAVAESVFSLGNEYMGVRGIMEEGVSNCPTLIGTYFNGIYEYAREATPIHYKGIIERTHFMINSVNFLYTEIYANDEKLDLGQCRFENFKRVLNLKTGELSRSFIWITTHGKLKLSFKRFLSMTNCREAYQHICIKSIDFKGQINIISGLDFGIMHWGKENYWKDCNNFFKNDTVCLSANTLTTNQRVMSAFKLKTNTDGKIIKNENIVRQKFAAQKISFEITDNQNCIIDKKIINIAEKIIGNDDLLKVVLKAIDKQDDYEEAETKNRRHWDNFWSLSDIEIVGDNANQQGIRFCLFNLHQTYHGIDSGNNIGAKGLTGEAYSGHTFWDTETYCLPYYMFTDISAAKNLLLYRYKTLPQAQNRAKELDCIGACYPVATLNGKEACNLWQHASLQFQPSTGVAYGIKHYMRLSRDFDFLYREGIEMLVEISRFLISRGQWNATHTKFGYYAVMGPDEFQMMVNHNCYTNYMAKKTLEYTVEVLNCLKNNDIGRYNKISNDEEMHIFSECEKNMYIPYNAQNKLFEQHEGFFDLPHIDINKIPSQDFPLYYHWSYDRIYRNDMIKQPDVLMFMFLFSGDFTQEQLKANYEYYEPRTIHESSLSPSIHSIIASALGKDKEALNFFRFATRMDLDDYNRNANEGLHMTSIAAAWMNIVYGFGGLRSDTEEVYICPSIPDIWKEYSFKINLHGKTYKISVNNKNALIDSENTTVTIPLKKKYILK